MQLLSIATHAGADMGVKEQHSLLWELVNTNHIIPLSGPDNGVMQDSS